MIAAMIAAVGVVVVATAAMIAANSCPTQLSKIQDKDIIQEYPIQAKKK
jgi:hypothetical protein